MAKQTQRELFELAFVKFLLLPDDICNAAYQMKSPRRADLAQQRTKEWLIQRQRVNEWCFKGYGLTTWWLKELGVAKPTRPMCIEWHCRIREMAGLDAARMAHKRDKRYGKPEDKKLKDTAAAARYLRAMEKVDEEAKIS